MIIYFQDTPTTEIYTLSLHDALPIFQGLDQRGLGEARRRLGEVLLRLELVQVEQLGDVERGQLLLDRKSTRLNSSHVEISYAVFCLKKKTNLNLTATICIRINGKFIF